LRRDQIPGDMASFRGDQLHKPFNTAEDCDRSLGICEDLAATNSLPSNVLGRDRLYLSPSVPGSPTERHNGANIDGTTSCQQSTCTIVRSGNPAPSTVADSDDDNPPPPSSVVTPSAAPTLHTSAGPAGAPLDLHLDYGGSVDVKSPREMSVMEVKAGTCAKGGVCLAAKMGARVYEAYRCVRMLLVA
jgi:hypothetical protein